MFARVMTFRSLARATPEQVQQATELIVERDLPTIRQSPGCRSAYYLYDSPTGKLLTVTVWETEEALEASEEQAARMAAGAGRMGIMTHMGTERFRVLATA